MSQTPNPDWERQRAFLAVMTEGSLSAAARLLNVAQPTVRHRVEELERQLGIPLFTRSPSGLEPTEMARQLGEHARAMAIAAEAFERAASGEVRSETGTVRITASEVIGVEVLPPIFAALREDHPGLVFELGLNNQSEDLLRREADIAIRMVQPRQKALVAKRVGAVRLGLHAHQRYLAAHGIPGSVAELKAHALIGFETKTVSVRSLRELGLDLVRADFAFRADSDLAHLAAIRAGIGIGICQSRLAGRDRELIAVLPRDFHFDLETWVVMHEDQRGVHRIRLVFDRLVEGLTSYIRAG